MNSANDLAYDDLDHIAADAQVDAHSIRARAAERNRLRADIDAFLASGGKVTKVEAHFRADQPKKPQNNYGKGSL